MWIDEKLVVVGGGGHMGVVGESHYQPALRQIQTSIGRNFTATLKPEPDSPHDANAVAICGPSGETLGYLRKRVAAEYHDVLKQNGGLACSAKITGGTREKPTCGVVLDWRPAVKLKHTASRGR